jgi:hypothetical protein
MCIKNRLCSIHLVYAFKGHFYLGHSQILRSTCTYTSVICICIPRIYWRNSARFPAICAPRPPLEGKIAHFFSPQWRKIGARAPPLSVCRKECGCAGVCVCLRVCVCLCLCFFLDLFERKSALRKSNPVIIRGTTYWLNLLSVEVLSNRPARSQLGLHWCKLYLSDRYSLKCFSNNFLLKKYF